MNKLIELLSIEANEISNAFKKASLEGAGTPQEISDRREGAFKYFLEKYFPYPYRVVKGNIIDSYGNTSQSIDCIVLFLSIACFRRSRRNFLSFAVQSERSSFASESYFDTRSGVLS